MHFPQYAIRFLLLASLGASNACAGGGGTGPVSCTDVQCATSCEAGSLGACVADPGGPEVCVCTPVSDAGGDSSMTMDGAVDSGAVDSGAVDSGVVDAGPAAPTCSACATDANCGAGRCVSFPGGELGCLPTCSSDLPVCEDTGFRCAYEPSVTDTTVCIPFGDGCCVDGDMDGYGEGVSCAATDCDDTSDAVHPGATEVCNGVDDNCDGTVDEGFDLNTDPSHCGSCETACMLPTDGTPGCAAGVCTVGMCPAGLADCDGEPATGCEVSTVTLTDCGACGVVCAPAHASGDCGSGTCGVATCDAGWADCDGEPATGCEVSTVTLTDCGACGVACAPAHASGDCGSGTCGVATCDAGWADCDADPATGCETSLTAITDCGGCGVTCAPAHGAGDCSTGTCAVASCDAGYQLVAGVCVDVDECATGSACSPFATCTNTPGSFSCTCNAGYVGDGASCALIVVTVTISSDVANVDLFGLAGSPSSPREVQVTIAPGVTVRSASPSLPAFTTGALPAGSHVTLTNNGIIRGAGGAAGRGANVDTRTADFADGAAGVAGGAALDLTAPTTLDNSGGYIQGGGGGGGGGGNCHGTNFLAGGGGGGGGAGLVGGAGGALGVGFSGAQYANGSPGTAGGATPGAGGAGGSYAGVCFGGAGGAGGAFGVAGQPGVRGTGNFGHTNFGLGGAAGNAVTLNGFSITWLGGNTAARVAGPVS